MARFCTPVVVAALLVFFASGAAAQNDVDGLKAAAARGDTAAMVDLGRVYTRGIGVARDHAQAVQLFRRAADAGNSDAMYWLAVLHSNHGLGVPNDEAQAAGWYRKAVDLGHGRAMFFLGLSYWAGRGVTQDYVEAYKWLDLASRFDVAPFDRKAAADTRDSLARAKAMSAERIAEGLTRARTWQTAFETQLKVAAR